MVTARGRARRPLVQGQLEGLSYHAFLAPARSSFISRPRPIPSLPWLLAAVVVASAAVSYGVHGQRCGPGVSRREDGRHSVSSVALGCSWTGSRTLTSSASAAPAAGGRSHQEEEHQIVRN
eukprot:9426801-Pyramimonas_sp.AAC.1